MIDIFESIMNSAPVIQKIFPFDCMIAVTDKEKFLYYLPGDKLKHDSPVGKAVAKGDGIWEAINNRQVFTTIISKSVWGIPFKNVSTPLFNEQREVVGAIGFAYSLENQGILQNAVHTIVSSSQQVTASSQELTKNAQLLYDKLDMLKNSMEATIKSLDKSDEILLFLKDIVTQSNILGLNASVEAAKAGQYGLGFSVVASEIRKLSVNSTNSIKETQTILGKIKDEISDHNKEIRKVDEISSHQQLAAQEISNAIFSLSSLAEDIQELALKI